MALYHKHRPQTFKDVIGQDHIIKTITNQITNERIAHAYLFSGPRGVGKTTTARLLAKGANCLNRQKRDAEPCDNCASCKEISESRSIDVIEIDAASYTGVDNVRENIIENAQFRPTKSKHKVFIIDEAHMLSTAAFNALLKILEEPPEYVIFILATTELRKLPETIISRCQRFGFKKVAFDEMKKHIEKITKAENIKIDKEVVENIINKSDNCVRDAVSLLDQIMATGEKNITKEIASIVIPSSNAAEIIQFISYLVEKDTKSALVQINKLAEEGVNLLQFSNDIIELLRVMIITKVNPKSDSKGMDLSKDAEKELIKLNKQISNKKLVMLVDLIIKRKQEIKSTPIPQLPLELAIIEWCGDNEQLTTNNEQEIDKKDSPTPNASENPFDTTQDKPEKKGLKQIVKDLVHKEPAFSLEDVKNNWDEFTQKIEGVSASLAFIIKSSSLSSVNGNTIQLSVSYGLHRDKLMNNESKKNIEDIFSEVLKNKAKIEVIVEEKDPATEQTDQKEKIDNELQDLAAAFGGEVIN